MALLNKKMMEDIVLVPRSPTSIMKGSRWIAFDDGGFYWEFTKEKNGEEYGIFIKWYGENDGRNRITINEPDLYFDTPFNKIYSAYLLGVDLPNGQSFQFA